MRLPEHFVSEGEEVRGFIFKLLFSDIIFFTPAAIKEIPLFAFDPDPVDLADIRTSLAFKR
jgi:hypothetical protein